jgi:hypothetical protein
MSALSIHDDIGSQEPRRRARRESDGRVSARLIAIANAVDQRVIGWDCPKRHPW